MDVNEQSKASKAKRAEQSDRVSETIYGRKYGNESTCSSITVETQAHAHTHKSKPTEGHHITHLERGNTFRHLEALSVDDAGTSLIVLLLGDPHLLEGGERGQNGATDPDGVLSLGRSDDLDLHGGRSHGGDLLLHAIGDAGVHGRTAGKDRVGVQILRRMTKMTCNLV